MNKKFAIILIILLIAFVVWYYIIRKQPLTTSQNVSDSNIDLSKIFGTNIAKPSQNSSNAIVSAAQDLQLANLANQTVEKLTGKSLIDLGKNVVDSVLGKAGATVEETATNLVSKATPDLIAQAAAPGVQEALTPAAGAIASASSPMEAIAAADAAVPGGFSAMGLAAGIAPIVLILAVANAWGVFDAYDPHAEFQKFKLGFDVPELGLRAGDTIDWIPNAIYDKMNADPANAETVLRSFIANQIAQNEAKQSAIQQVQTADVNNTPLTQTVKENIAVKTTGNKSTIYN